MKRRTMIKGLVGAAVLPVSTVSPPNNFESYEEMKYWLTRAPIGHRATACPAYPDAAVWTLQEYTREDTGKTERAWYTSAFGQRVWMMETSTIVDMGG